MIIVLTVFTLKTVYNYINLSKYVPKSCKTCHDDYHGILQSLLLLIVVCSKTIKVDDVQGNITINRLD